MTTYVDSSCLDVYSQVMRCFGILDALEAWCLRTPRNKHYHEPEFIAGLHLCFIDAVRLSNDFGSQYISTTVLVGFVKSMPSK